MRKEGSVFSMMRERNLDLLRAYRKVINENMRSDKELVYMDILTQTVNSGASRYWVSRERAFSVIYQMNKEREPPSMKDKAKIFYKRFTKVRQVITYKGYFEDFFTPKKN